MYMYLTYGTYGTPDLSAWADLRGAWSMYTSESYPKSYPNGWL